MQLFLNTRQDPAFNLALEERLTASLHGDAFLLWRNPPSVIIGRNQNTLTEVDRTFLETHHIPAVRRMTGGGTVYHDPGNVNFSFMTDAAGRDFSSFEPFAAPILAVLHDHFQIDAEFSGRNDILVDGRKISGTAKLFTANRVLFHGTLLFDVDFSILEDVLTPSEDKIRHKGIRSVRARVANLKEFLPQLTPDLFFEELQQSLLRYFGRTGFDPFPETAIREAEELARIKYRTWEWNFGGAPAYDYRKSARFAGGTVELGLVIRHGKIESIRFTGDFFGERPVTELYAVLTGVEHRIDAVRAALQNVAIPSYFLGITKEEIISLFV